MAAPAQQVSTRARWQLHNFDRITPMRLRMRTETLSTLPQPRAGPDADVVRLLGWNTGEPIAEERYLQLLSDPRFPQAARALAVNMLAVAAANEALDGIFKDAGRYLASMWAIYLHLSGGLTLPRLKQVCAESGFLSSGRARDLLRLLLHLEFIEKLGPAGGRRPARYAPTATFMAAWRSHLEAALRAARVLEPAVDRVLDALDSQEVLETLARIQSESLLAAAKTSDQSWAFTRVFLHRHAGNQIAWTLMTAGEEGAFPSEASAPINIAEMSRRFGVSRIHIRRLFDDAGREGLLRWRDGAVVLEPAARTQIQFIYAAQLVQLLAAAAGTIRERPELS